MMDTIEVKFLINRMGNSGRAPFCGVFSVNVQQPISFSAVDQETKKGVAEKYASFGVDAKDVVVVQITNRSLMGDYIQKSKQVFLPGSHFLEGMEFS
ncbi:hypothetical protein [Pseudoalteromonas luteoviolacea]|uniref:hypothetical protein n=1 Tax=Pseudoalteromonas luteoviolacea TaxID=43657 RepID=UPI001B35E33A|nr:hypothetical protein [Pseudoalteromonas luteoviolacea]MBQ4839999.1 hypothetical protein [Pseudoalteromonas luteoviolacea]